MNPKRKGAIVRSLLAMVCAVILVMGQTVAYAQTMVSPPAPATGDQTPPATVDQAPPASTDQAAKIPPEQLDSLVAPIALYPDPLLAQTLAASTYPLEIIQLQQWLARNPGLKDQALADAVAKQPWDPSVQAMAPLPDVVKRLADDIQWTTDLGNAFLAQQSDVMDAVQRMRKKAQETGALKSTEQQKVETQVVENKSVIVVEQADPQVVYVPSYDPVVVYGPPVYPYPPIYYPPPGYYAGGLLLTFGLGVAMGAAWSGGWGWGCGWGDNNVNINNSNNFNRQSNRGELGGNRGDRGGRGEGGNWKHNPQHRGGAPYGDRATANRFGGQARGESLGNRQAGARQQVGRQGGNLASSQAGRAGVSTRPSGGRDVGSARGGAGGADRIGSRDVSRTSGGGRDAFGGGSRGYNGASARASSSRGQSSMSSSRGGSRSGASRGGGGRSGGGGRGGGGRGGGRR